MEKINWSSYDGETTFTLFCNALLSFELGKLYQPSSAKGPDGGIDGAFEGNYQGDSGKWRFQYKFRSGARLQSYQGLKSTVKTELRSLTDEDFYVLLTNIELLPQEITEFEKTLQEEATRMGKKCECKVWDGAKLFNLYLQYPLLQLWLQDGFPTAQLQDYKIILKRELVTTEFLPGTLSNPFFAREDDLKKISDFLVSEASIALVTGEAGIGKTRLVLEFFKDQVDPDPDWTPLALLNRNIDFDKISKALTGANNYIILIDDAHTYAPEIIADMSRICHMAANKIKLILTSRNLEAFQSLNLLKEYEQTNIPHFKLKELSRKDTEAMFRHEVARHPHYSNFISELVEISYGKPILIVALLRAIQEGLQVAQIREQDFLRNYVKNYFNSYYTSVEQLTGWSKLQAQCFLQLVVLIEPFNYNDINIVQKLTEVQGLRVEEGVAALNLLRKTDLVDWRYLQSIKPDYYSDILLADIDSNKVAEYIGEFVQFLDNIVINLGSVDESSFGEKTFLNGILTKYISLIKDTNEIEVVDRVLDTILSIVGYKPKIAQDAVEIYLECLQDNHHVIHQDWAENKDRPGYSMFTPLNKVIELLSFLCGLQEFYDFTFRKSMQLFSLTEDIKVVRLFAFGRKDVIDQFRLSRQQFFLQEFNRRLKRITDQELKFGLQVINSWLNLDFMVGGSSAANRFEMNITTYYLPANTSVKKLRKNIVELLIKVYMDFNQSAYRLEILKDLLEIPRSIFATSKNAKPYHNNEEIKMVLDFLDKEAVQFDIKEKKEIEEKLFWFRRWGIPESFHSQSDTIKQKLQPKNLTEQLSQLFSRAELSIIREAEIKTKITTTCRDLVKQFDAETMTKSIIEFLESDLSSPTYFYVFLNELIENHSDYAKALYTRMSETAPELFTRYGADILYGAYYVFKDIDFYWSEVRKLQKMGTVEADNMLLLVYGRGASGNTMISENDISVIIKVFNKKRKENNFNLARSIQSLIATGYHKTQEVCIEFLKRADQREAEMFFLWLSDNKKVSSELLEELVLNHTARFHLTYEIERCLNKVLRDLGQDVIFDYLCRRYEHKKNTVRNQRTAYYEFVPDGDHSRLFKGITERKPAMFIKALEWYLALDADRAHLYYAKDMLEYLKPEKSLNQESLLWYQDKINQLDDQALGLDRIIDSLSIFEIKDDNLLDLVIQGFMVAYDLYEIQPDYYKLIRQGCYLAITTMGVKSGTAGEPFQVDLDLRNLLQVRINSMPEYMPATVFLKEVLKSIEADIHHSTEKDNLRW